MARYEAMIDDPRFVEADLDYMEPRCGDFPECHTSSIRCPIHD